MKILFIHVVDTHEQFGGAEMSSLTLMREIPRDGNFHVAVALNRGRLFDEVSSCGVRVYELPPKGVLNVPRFFSALYNMLKDFNPDIIHSQHRYTTVLAQVLPFRRYKLIHTFRVEQFTKRWNMFYGDYATAVSKGCKEHFVKYFNLKEDFIEVIYNGIYPIDVKKYEPLLKRDDTEIIASVIGRLTEQKGHCILLKAISLLPPSYRRKLKVFFVGEGEKRSEIEREIDHLGLNEDIVLIGRKEDVYPYILASDFTILPSLWEGLSRAVIESYFCGKPVICSQVAGTPEVVIDNETGILVPSNNPERLAQAIVYFMDNPALVKKFGETGKKIALEKFTVAKMVENYKAFYKKVIEENNAS